MKTNETNLDAGQFKNTNRMPALFIGHGSPMNAIEVTEFSEGWRKIGSTLPRPAAILCISAHWETNGTLVTAMDKPRTIHDFGGFPGELYDVQYPAPGSPELANEIKNNITKAEIGLDQKWGLDHGAWSVIKHLYPNADVPVVQMSLDHDQPPQYHYELAKELSYLRKKGVLIIGSGNLVHNLRVVNWSNQDTGYDWAIKANSIFKKLISGNEHNQLINYKNLGNEVQLSIPTPEHYLPLLYIIALKEYDENITFFNDKISMGSLSMLSLKIDKV